MEDKEQKRSVAKEHNERMELLIGKNRKYRYPKYSNSVLQTGAVRNVVKLREYAVSAKLPDVVRACDSLLKEIFIISEE